jgi:hypothetical protein
LAEANGRGHFREGLHFLYYARGSLLETQHWLRCAVRRNLLSPAHVVRLRECSIVLGKQLNAFTNAQRSLPKAAPRQEQSSFCEEEPAAYTVSRRPEVASSATRSASRQPASTPHPPRAISHEPRATSHGPRATSQEPRAKRRRWTS